MTPPPGVDSGPARPDQPGLDQPEPRLPQLRQPDLTQPPSPAWPGDDFIDAGPPAAVGIEFPPFGAFAGEPGHAFTGEGFPSPAATEQTDTESTAPLSFFPPQPPGFFPAPPQVLFTARQAAAHLPDQTELIEVGQSQQTVQFEPPTSWEQPPTPASPTPPPGQTISTQPLATQPLATQPWHAQHERPGEWQYQPPEHLAWDHSPPAESLPAADPIWAGSDSRTPAWQVPFLPEGKPKTRRTGLWVSLALTIALVFCGGGGISAYFLISNADTGKGAPDPATAVNRFLTAVYTQQDATAAEDLVCRAARDPAALTDRVNQIKNYTNEYEGPTFRWDEPAVAAQTDERATVSVQLTMSTDDEKTAQQTLSFTTVHKTGWLVCDISG